MALGRRRLPERARARRAGAGRRRRHTRVGGHRRRPHRPPEDRGRARAGPVSALATRRGEPQAGLVSGLRGHPGSSRPPSRAPLRRPLSRGRDRAGTPRRAPGSLPPRPRAREDRPGARAPLSGGRDTVGRPGRDGPRRRAGSGPRGRGLLARRPGPRRRQPRRAAATGSGLRPDLTTHLPRTHLRRAELRHRPRLGPPLR